MRLRCRLGLHPWHKREATARPGTIIRRCPDCGKLAVVHRRRTQGPRLPSSRLLSLLTDLLAWICIVGGIAYYMMH